MDHDDRTTQANVARAPAAAGGWQAGRTLFSRYRLERELGHGGMGVVWLAHDEELERPVALKILLNPVVRNQASLRDLKRETRRSLELTHPHIVRIYDFVQDEQTAAISMEYVDSDSLRNLRCEQPGGVFDCAQLRDWTRQLCQALDYAHGEASIVHRDIKPANLMVNRKNQLKVTDFGISRSLLEMATDHTGGDRASGTLAYMSPQQLGGDRPSPLDDVYAMGATLYELLTSRPPFYAGDIMGQIYSKVAPTMAERRASLEITSGVIPRNWESTVAACLAKNPTQRPSSAGEVAVRLGLAEAASVATPKAGVRRRRALAVGFLVVLTLLLVAAGVLWSLMNLDDSAPPPRYSSPAVVREERPPAEPAPPVQGSGSLLVKTEPEGAFVEVDGAPPVNSVNAIEELKPGRVKVRVSLDGYEPRVVEAAIEENKRTTLEAIKLERSKGSLRIFSKPEGLAFEIKNPAHPEQITRGTTPTAPAVLPAGDYEISISREGWPPQRLKTTVRGHEEQQASFEFAGAGVALTSEPTGAKVLADGVEVGTTPLTMENLPPGPVRFTLELKGYAPVAVTGDVAAGQMFESKVILKKATGQGLSRILPWNLFRSDKPKKETPPVPAPGSTVLPEPPTNP